MDRIQAQSDLAFIKKVMEDSRKRLEESGLPYIIWGALSILGTGLTYGAVFLELWAAIPWIWVGFGLVGGMATFIYMRIHRRNSPRTFADGLYAVVWAGVLLFFLVIGICLFIIRLFDLRLIMAITAGGMGLAYFVSSAISRNRWVFAFSFAWWAGSIVMALIDGFYAPLLLSGLVLACELVPGIVLHARYLRLLRRAAVTEEG